MKRILVTGATGNVGQAVIKYLQPQSNFEIHAGVRTIDKASDKFKNKDNLKFVAFDFEDETTHNEALKNIDIVFLLRPPHLSDVPKFFCPLIEKIKEAQITKIVFLSVQGVETSSIIPHHKIEKLILQSGLDYIFVRPSYFMQNLSTTFLKEIQTKKSVSVPAGKGIFNWIDVENIGEATAQLIINFTNYKNRGYDITGNENKPFSEVIEELSYILETKIRYKSPSLLSFFMTKRKDGIPNGFIVVMILLHFLPRLQKPPIISENYKILTGKEPTRLKGFFEREKELFL